MLDFGKINDNYVKCERMNQIKAILDGIVDHDFELRSAVRVVVPDVLYRECMRLYCDQRQVVFLQAEAFEAYTGDNVVSFAEVYKEDISVCCAELNNVIASLQKVLAEVKNGSVNHEDSDIIHKMKVATSLIETIDNELQESKEPEHLYRVFLGQFGFPQYYFGSFTEDAVKNGLLAQKVANFKRQYGIINPCILVLRRDDGFTRCIRV
jgi:hypothetical protein